MGMPIITPGDTTKDQAITDVITSIATQESALSHIINAESEKMQAVIQMEEITEDELLTLNQSVELMLNAITNLEIMLQSKLNIVSPCPAATDLNL